MSLSLLCLFTNLLIFLHVSSRLPINFTPLSFPLPPNFLMPALYAHTIVLLFLRVRMR